MLRSFSTAVSGMRTQMTFMDTVANNIRLGRPDATMEAVIAAGRAANIHDEIMAMDRGYDTVVGVGSGARGISVGQKQLISFARAMAYDPPILILDEATSSIDSETELLIRDAVARLMTGRTSVIIAHRLSTIQSVDKIIVLHKGELREQGSHQELLALRGLYYRLYRLQYKDQEIERPPVVAD